MLKLPTLPTNTEYANKNIFEAMEQLDIYEDENKVEHFRGQQIISELFAIYLRQKYKSTCFDKMYMLNRELIFIVDYSQKITDEIIINIIKQQSAIIERILDCIEQHEPLIVIPISWKMQNGSSNNFNGHKNLLIYRDSLKQIEHFEPHGAKRRSEDAIYNYVNEIMKAFVRVINMNLKIKTNIKYIPPNVVCPKIGFQTFEHRSKLKKFEREGKGYCTLWSLYFMELVLKNPDMESSKIISLFYSKLSALPVDKQNNFFRKLARAYSHIINEKLQRHFTGATKILKKGSTKEIIEIMHKKKYVFNKEQFSIDIDKHVKKMGQMELMTPVRKLEISKCPEGKILNPKTNRCIKINRSKTEKKKPEPQPEKKPEPQPEIKKKTLKQKICPEGKILNPKTNRCIKINRSKTEKKIEENPAQKTCPKGKVLQITYKCVAQK